MFRTSLLVAVFCAFHVQVASADPKAGCKDPSWAPTPIPGYELSDCDSKPYGEYDAYLAKGETKLFGEVSYVTYRLTDESKNWGAKKARDYYEALGKKAGGKVISDPTDIWKVMLEKKVGKDDFFWEYAHGDGNDASTGSYTLHTIRVSPPAQFVVAKAPKGALDTATKEKCGNPPWLVTGYPSFELDSCEARDFDQISYETDKRDRKTIAGRMLHHTYKLTDEKKNPTAIAVQRNFITALEKIGAKLESSTDDIYHAVLSQRTASGTYWYLYEHASGNEDSTGSYTLTTVQVGGPASKQCKLEIYGVNFDTDKSTLRPDSDPVLEQVLALFKSDPKLTADLSGHTDDTGKKDYNMKLSEDRANAVMAWLVSHGVDAGRLTAHGYGDTKPLVPNTNDANRQKNRRVELEKKNCK